MMEDVEGRIPLSIGDNEILEDNSHIWLKTMVNC